MLCFFKGGMLRLVMKDSWMTSFITQLKHQHVATPSLTLIATVWRRHDSSQAIWCVKGPIRHPCPHRQLIKPPWLLSMHVSPPFLSPFLSLSGLDTSLFSSPLLNAHPPPQVLPPLWLAETFAWSLHIFHFRSHYALVAPDRPPWLILMNWKSQLKVNFQPAPLHIHIHIQTNPASIVH